MKNIYKIIVLMFCLFHLNDLSNAQTKLTAEDFAGYFGGTGSDYMTYAATDKNGNIIIAGQTNSSALPVTSLAFQKAAKLNPCDGFIAKFNPEMNQLI